EKKTKKDVSKDDSAPGVIVRLNDGKALAATRKVGNGEVVFVGTAAHHEGLDVRTFNPTWTDLGTSPVFIPFLDVTTNYLVHGQTQNYNLKAGDVLKWYPTDRVDQVYNL